MRETQGQTIDYFSLHLSHDVCHIVVVLLRLPYGVFFSFLIVLVRFQSCRYMSEHDAFVFASPIKIFPHTALPFIAFMPAVSLFGECQSIIFFHLPSLSFTWFPFYALPSLMNYKLFPSLIPSISCFQLSTVN